MRSDRKWGARTLRIGLMTGAGAAVTAGALSLTLGHGGANADGEKKMAEAAAKALVRENLPKLPIAFEANHGQTDKSVRFVARGAGTTLWLTDSEAVFVM